MHRTLVILLALAAVALSGCAVQDLNPFSTRSLNPGEVVYSQFSDVPVPREMTTDQKRSFISYSQDGSKNGLETLEGGFDLISLTRGMINNMMRDGWSLRATSSGANRHMQLYERDNRYALLYFYEQTASTAMEVWVSNRLAEGAYQPPLDPVGSGTPGYTPSSSAPSSPVSSSPDGGLQERALP